MKKSLANIFFAIVVMQVDALNTQLFLKGGPNIAKFSSSNAANFLCQ